MSSIIEFRKEFEDIILKGNIEEALKTLVSNSEEKLYIQFCEEYKKCIISKKISKALHNIFLESLNLKNRDLQRIILTRFKLLEYDLPSTSKESKNSILEYLFENYCKENLNHEQPSFVRLKKTEDKKEKDIIKNKTPLLLTEKMINEEIEREIKC